MGLLSSSIFRCEESIVKSYAIKLALSLQLINILRDINEDLNSGRFYFPQDELKKFNLTENDFKKKLKDETLKSFLSFQIKRIEDIFKESQALLPNSCKENQISSIIMGKIYIKILEKIKKNPLDALTKKVHISPLRKVMISISAFSLINYGKIAIIGGGWAGLTSALLSENNEVHLFESSSNLGGRARSFKQKDNILDNGSHLFFLIRIYFQNF